MLLPRCSQSHTFTPLIFTAASQVHCFPKWGRRTWQQENAGNWKGVSLELHQEMSRNRVLQKSHPNRSISGPQPDLAHELGKGKRMLAWEVTARTPGWGLTGPLPGWRRQNGQRWKICVCSEPCGPRLGGDSPAPCGLTPAGRRKAGPACPWRARTVGRGTLIRASAERVQPGPTSGGTSQLCGR